MQKKGAPLTSQIESRSSLKSSSKLGTFWEMASLAVTEYEVVT